jgi:hypothetical protein
MLKRGMSLNDFESISTEIFEEILSTEIFEENFMLDIKAKLIMTEDLHYVVEKMRRELSS